MKKFFIIFFSVAFLLAVGLKAQSMLTPSLSSSNQSINPTPTQKISNVPYEETFTGEYVCLPHKDTKSPQTLECALGLKLVDGSYIAMGRNEPLRYVAGDRLKVSGTFVPIEQLSTDQWRKYPIKGILQVKEAQEIGS